MQKELEERILTLAKDKDNFDIIVKSGVIPEHFVIHLELFDFIAKYYYKYNSVPSEAIVKSNFPEFEYIADVKKEELTYLVDELAKSLALRRAIRVINEAQDTITKDPYGSIETVINKLSGIKKKVQNTRSFTDKDALQRFEEVMKNKNDVNKGLTIGIKTGISILDEQQLGWQPGNLIVVAGRLGIGKSWLTLYFACSAYMAGKRVLYISPEMACREVDYRWDTIIGTMMGKLFLNDKLVRGDVNLKDYKEFLTKVSGRADWLTVDSSYGMSFTLQNISYIIDEFAPDLVVIDGITFIEHPNREIWERLKIVSDDLKKMAQNKQVVMIVSSQVNREAGEGMPKTTQVAYSDSVLQAANVSIMMSKDEDKPDVRYVTLPKVRNGKAVNKPIEVKFDVNKGIISL